MKNVTLTIIVGMLWSAIYAQNGNKVNESYFIKCTDFSISKPLRELAEEFPAIESSENELKKEAKDAERNKKMVIRANQNPNETEDQARQTSDGHRISSGPIVNFSALAGSFTPPDPSGAAGPNHYVQAVNCLYRAYDKSGVAVMSALNLKSLWTGSIDDGDPIVLYDKFADRWFIQQFQQTGNKILLAISTSPDPTGTYYKFTFVPNASDFPDYPKFSIWSDGYYMTANSTTQRAIIFERSKMILGDASAGMIVTTVPINTSAPMPKSGFFSPLTLDADGQLPPNGTPNYFMYYLDDQQQSGVTDAIAMYKITANWTTKTATVVFDSKLPTQAFNSYFTGGTQKDIVQPGGGSVDALDGFFAYRAPYRIWTGYNSVVVCNAVNLGSKVSGIRWYELRQDNTTKVWSIYQQGTYGPSDGVSRWIPSIAMDDNGSIGLAYAVSAATSIYPGLRYTGRLATDPLGQMTFAEQTAIAGTSAISGTRIGDYSQTSLDPDGVTFWHTGEYCSSGAKTRVFSFQLPVPTGLNDIQKQPQYSIYQTNAMLNLKTTNLPSEKIMNVDLFDISGKLISSQTITPVSGSFNTTIDISDLSQGMYFVRIGNSSFQYVKKVVLN